MNTELSELASEKESEGDYAEASRLCLRSASRRVSDHLGEPKHDQSKLNLAVADLLRAIYCGKRAEDTERVAAASNLFDGVADLLRVENTDRGFESILLELRGDAKLLLESREAADWYERAATEYAEFTETDRLSWGLEPEFVRAQWVVEDFLASKGVEMPTTTEEEDPFEMDFDRRLRWKKEVIRNLFDV